MRNAAGTALLVGAEYQTHAFFERNAELLDRAQRVERRDRRSLVVRDTAAVKNAVLLDRLEGLGHGPVALARHHVEVRQNIELALALAEVRRKDIVLVVLGCKAVALQHFLRCQERAVGAVSERLAGLRGALTRINAAEGLHILQKCLSVCIHPRRNLFLVIHTGRLLLTASVFVLYLQDLPNSRSLSPGLRSSTILTLQGWVKSSRGSPFKF